jgi:fucose 4-O-acetylase-like acetyltransferase
MNKRIDYIDTAKGIAIIAVVLSHAVTNSSNALEIDHPVLLNWLSFFNVSTFFFINGFLYNEKCIESPLKAILKKLRAYYIPFISYNLFFLLFQNLFVKAQFINSTNYINSVKSFLLALIQVLFGKMQPMTGPMWFLRALILISVLYILVDSFSARVFNGTYRYIINGIVAIALLELLHAGYAPAVFNFPTACDSFILFYLGVLYRRFNINDMLKKYCYIFGSISLLVSLVIANTIMVGIYGNLNSTLDLLSMIISIVFVISISQFKLISNLNVLKLFGKSSLEIMALHFLAFKPISYLFIKIYNLDNSYLAHTPVVKLSMPDIWPALYTISGMLLPVAFYVIKTKVKGRKQI